jgi:ribonuclease D
MHISYLTVFAVTCLGVYALSDSLRSLVNRSARGIVNILGWNDSSIRRVVCFGNVVQVKLCTNTKEIVDGLSMLGNFSLLGLDCEWRPKCWKGTGTQSVANKVAVLQLASPKICLVIQLLRATEDGVLLPQRLFDLLLSASVLKVGVGIRDDCQRLANDYGLTCRGLVDLRNLARRETLQVRAESLQALSAWAGLTLSKDPSIRLSDWAATHLRADQVQNHSEN